MPPTRPPNGKQPINRLPKVENERIIEETIRRIRLQFPALLAAVLPGVLAGGGGGDVLVDDSGNIIVDDSGNIVYPG